MSEFCSMQILCKTAHGKMYTCNSCVNKVVFCFKNITQSMSREYFEKFRNNISKLNCEKLFVDFPFEKYIHIRTEWNSLFYSFTKKEISEVKFLFEQADFKLKLFERYALFLN